MNKIKSETSATYSVNKTGLSDDEIVRHALNILNARMLKMDFITSPDVTMDYLKLHYANHTSEVFTLTLLDNRHGVIACVDLFHGTIDGCSVHPREIVKCALTHNAAAVILSHNHPSGNPDPSNADKQLTKRLTDALALIDVRVLDHIVIGGADSFSFAEHGLI